MTQLVLTSLGVFWAWEYLLTLSPVTIPAWLQPLLVAAAAAGAWYLPERVLLVAAVAGAVALLHQLLTATHAAQAVRQVRRVPRI